MGIIGGDNGKNREILGSNFFEGIEEVVINKDVVDGRTEPLLIYSDKKKPEADAS